MTIVRYKKDGKIFEAEIPSDGSVLTLPIGVSWNDILHFEDRRDPSDQCGAGTIYMHRAAAMISASKLPRIVACPYSETLPHKSDESGKAADRGKMIHEYVANHCEPILGYCKPADKELDLIDCEMPIKFCSSDGPVLSERAYFYNPRDNVTRELGRMLNREYPKPPGPEWIAMTIDLLHLGSDYAHINDLKTGRYVEPAYDSWQLRGQAVAIAALGGYDTIHVAHVIWRYTRWTVDVATFRKAELESFRQTLFETMCEIQVGMCEPNPGSHCKYCPGKTYCHAAWS